MSDLKDDGIRHDLTHREPIIIAATIPALWQRPGLGRVRCAVVHTTQEREVGNGARGVARYFGGFLNVRPPSPGASCHIVVDNLEIIRCVADEAVAYGVPGRLADGTKINAGARHLELQGLASQTEAEWGDPYSLAAIANAARVLAAWCRRDGLPMDRPDLTELGRRDREGLPIGIVGHWDLTRYTGVGDHVDPGPNFPWGRLLEATRAS